MAAERASRPFLRRLAKPALAICATLFALLLGEGLVRALDRAPDVKPIQLDAYNCIYKRSLNPILGFELKANWRSDTPDFIQTYERTNAHGQRDRERSLDKPEGVRRILLLGDSVVEGYGLRESETLSQQLEALYPDGATEVLNFGVSAYCTRAEVELLEKKGLQFDPDIVVLVFVENDFDNFNREAFPLGGTIERPALAKALFQRSHLFRLASVELNLFQFGTQSDPVRWNQEAIGDNNVAEGLQRFWELAERHGFQPIIAIWPRFLDERITDVCFMPQDSQQLVIEGLAALHRIPSVRLSTFFQRHHATSGGTLSPRLRYSAGDELHPSPEGSRVAAQALQQILTELSAGSASVVQETPRADNRAAEALGQAQPNYARVYNRMGTEFLKAGKLKEALDAFQQALAADSGYAGAYNNLGVTYERLGQGDAQAQFERAVKLQPDFSHAHFNLARILIQKKQWDQAIAQLERTLQLDPKHVAALNMLGMALGRQQRFAEAQSYLERAVRLDPKHAEARSNLGAAYAGQGRLREAAAQFEAALRIDPDDLDVRETLKRVKAALAD